MYGQTSTGTSTQFIFSPWRVNWNEHRHAIHAQPRYGGNWNGYRHALAHWHRQAHRHRHGLMLSTLHALGHEHVVDAQPLVLFRRAFAVALPRFAALSHARRAAFASPRNAWASPNNNWFRAGIGWRLVRRFAQRTASAPS